MNVQIIAKRYADALFTQAGGAKNSKKMWDELHELAALVQTNQDFKNLVKSPVILDSEKEAVFKALKDGGKISDVLYNFICLLIEKKRLNIISDIDAEIHKLVLSDAGEIEALAVFASKPESAEKKELETKLSTLTGKKVLLKDSVDSSVIGGVKVRMGSILYDATVRGQLNKLKSRMV